MAAEMLVLRVVHVLGGVFWVGAMMYNAFFLMPALSQAGPAAGPVMAGMQQRKLFMWLPIVAVATMLAGIRLLMIQSAGFSSVYFGTSAGRTYLLGGVVAIVAFAIGLFISRPTMMRMSQLSAALPTAEESRRAAMQEEMAVLRRRGATSGTIVTWMLIAATVAMAVGRYV